MSPGRRSVGATLLALLVVLLPLGTRTQAASPTEQDWAGAFAAYAARAGGSRALLLLARHGVAGLGPLYYLALADADMRAGRWQSAATAFRHVVAAEPGSRWGALAELGLGWMALRADERAEARAHLVGAVESGGDIGQLATLLLALLDGIEGQMDASAAAFDLAAADPATSATLRLVAMLGKGYSHYWRGDDAGAIEAFEHVAASPPEGPLADDALYGAARARWRSGDEADALAAWRELAKRPQARGGGGVSQALLDLEPRALMSAGFRRFRRLPLGHPEEEVVALLDADGSALARRALWHFGGHPEPTVQTSASSTPAPASRERATTTAAPPSARPATPVPGSPARMVNRPTSWLATLAATVIALLLGLAWCVRRLVGP